MNLTDLITKKQYQQASDLLSQQPLSQNNYHMLSLLYRYIDRYDKEHDIIQRGLQNDPNWHYGHERMQWHNLTLFNKMVPRPYHGSETEHKPQQSTIEQMCFLTSADDHYFEPLVQHIEAIRATKYYKDVPICVVESNITDEHKHFINTNYHNVYFKNVNDCPIKFPEGTLDLLKMTTAKCFHNLMFPGYRFYCFLDCDMWVHDEAALHTLICICEKQGISAWCSQGHRCIDYQWFKEGILTAQQIQELGDKSIIPNNVYCIDASQHWFSSWQALMYEIISRNKLIYGHEEASLAYLIHSKNITEFITNKEHLVLWFWIPPVYADNPHVLIGQDGHTPVGLLHMTGWMTGFLGRQVYHYYLPSTIIDKPMTQQETNEHTNNSFEVLKKIKDEGVTDFYTLDFFKNPTHISIYYRVWPFQDKPDIEREIVRLAS